METVKINIELVVTDSKGYAKQRMNLSVQEFYKLREQINILTQDVLEPPYVRIDEKEEDILINEAIIRRIFGEDK